MSGQYVRGAAQPLRLAASVALVAGLLVAPAAVGTDITTAIALTLALVLCIAAASKVRDLSQFEVVLVRLAPSSVFSVIGSRWLARGVVTIEFATAALLLIAPSDSWGLLVALWTLVLFGGFAVTIEAARRKRVACGCSGASKSRTGPWEMCRAAGLLAGALTLAVLAALEGSAAAPGTAPAASVAVAAAGAIILLYGPMLLGRVRSATREQGDPQGVVTEAHAVAISRRSLLARAGGLVVAVTLGPAAMRASSNSPMCVPGSDQQECARLQVACEVCCFRMAIDDPLFVPAFCEACCADCGFRCQMNKFGAAEACTFTVACDGCWMP